MALNLSGTSDTEPANTTDSPYLARPNRERRERGERAGRGERERAGRRGGGEEEEGGERVIYIFHSSIILFLIFLSYMPR